MIELNCKKCKKVFYIYPSRLKGNSGHKGLYCSKSCANSVTQNGKETRFIKGQKPYSYFHPEIVVRGKTHHNWKGDKVGYRGLHYWLKRTLGKPMKCSFCGKKRTTPKSIHWANISGHYLRDINDYTSLCAQCHYWFDLKT